MVKVSVIILNWNQPKFTIDCVSSVLKQTYNDFEVLIVDNASTDDSVEQFNNKFLANKQIRIIKNRKNDGYAGGNNFGMKQSKGEYVVILNNDTVVDRDWLEVLVKEIKSDKKIGAISSNERLDGKKENINFSKEGRTSTILQYPSKYSYKKEVHSDCVDIFSVKGASFIFRKKVVGLPFDKDYFIYGEDMYLGWFLRLKGYTNKLAIKSGLDHYHNTVKKSSKKINKYFVFLGERNRWINFLIFYERKNIFKIFPLMFLSSLFLLLVEPKKILPRMKSCVWILTHCNTIRKKRKFVQSKRVVSDKEIVLNMSSKFYEESFFSNKLAYFLIKCLNFISKLYLRIISVKTIDM